MDPSEKPLSTPSSLFVLRVRADRRERLFPVRVGVNRIGRHRSSDIQLNHPLISRCQATLICSADGRVKLQDGDGKKGSANGTYVNDHRIKSCLLEVGAVIQFGQSKIVASLLAIDAAIPKDAEPVVTGSPPIRVVIADDQKMVQEMLQLFLEREADIEIVGIAADGREALAQMEKISPDVVLVDIEMPGLGGLETVQVAHKRFPQIPIVVLTTHDREDYINHALHAGAKGYLPKTIGAKELVRAIRSVHNGFVQLGPGIFEKLLPVDATAITQAFPLNEDGSPSKGATLNLLASAQPTLRSNSSSLSNPKDVGGAELLVGNTATHPVRHKSDPAALTAQDLVYALLPKFFADPIRRRVGLGAGVVTVGALILGLATLRYSRLNSLPSINEITILPVVARPVELVSSYSVTNTYTGAIVASRSSELNFGQAGEVVTIYVDEGDTVVAGASIARLDTRDLELQRSQLMAELAQAQAELQELQVGARQEDIASARASVRALEERFDLAQSRQQRRLELMAEGAISQEQLEEAIAETADFEARLQDAQSQLNLLLSGTRSEQLAAQRARVEQIRVSVDRINLELEESTLSAPFAARIASRYVNEGSTVDSSQPVVRLVEDGVLQARIGLPVGAVAQLDEASQQQIWVSDHSYAARVTAISPEVDNLTRTITVILDLEEGIDLSAGQVARLELSQTIDEEGYWLPTTALVPGDRGLWGAYSLAESSTSVSATAEADLQTNPPPTAGEDGLYRVERQAVEILFSEGERVFVRGTLEPGMQIVMDGTHRIVADQWVRAISETDSP